jgi:hypothetical protein
MLLLTTVEFCLFFLFIGCCIAQPKEINVTSCQRLRSRDTLYRLQNDVFANSTCFWMEQANIVLDLNGFTVTFDDAPVVDAVMDRLGEFEDAADLASLNVTGLPSAEACVSHTTTDAWYGSGALLIARSCRDIVIQFPPMRLAGNTSYSVDFFAYQQSNVQLEQSGISFTLLSADNATFRQSVTVDSRSRSDHLRSGFWEVYGDGVYQLTLTINNTLSSALRFDSIDFTRGRASGVVLGPHPYRKGTQWDGLDGNPSGVSSASTVRNVTIRNGRFVQGRHKSHDASAILTLSSRDEAYVNVTFIVDGRDAAALTGDAVTDVRVHNCTVLARNSNDTSRRSIDRASISVESACNLVISNTVFIGRGVSVDKSEVNCTTHVFNSSFSSDHGSEALKIGYVEYSVFTDNVISCDGLESQACVKFDGSMVGTTFARNTVRTTRSTACNHTLFSNTALSFNYRNLRDVTFTDNRFEASGTCRVVGCDFGVGDSETDPAMARNATFENNVCSARAASVDASAVVAVALQTRLPGLALRNDTLLTNQFAISTTMSLTTADLLFGAVAGADESTVLLARGSTGSRCTAVNVTHVDARWQTDALRRALEKQAVANPLCNRTFTGLHTFATTILIRLTADAPFGPLVAEVRNGSGWLVASASLDAIGEEVPITFDRAVATFNSTRVGAPFSVTCNDPSLGAYPLGDGLSGTTTHLCVRAKAIEACEAPPATSSTATSSQTVAPTTSGATTSGVTGADTVSPSGLSSGAVIGIAVGASIAALLLLIGVVALVVRRRGHNGSSEAATPHMTRASQMTEFESFRPEGGAEYGKVPEFTASAYVKATPVAPPANYAASPIAPGEQSDYSDLGASKTANAQAGGAIQALDYSNVPSL